MRLFTFEHELTTDDWYTPPAIFDALDITFDLDPCAPPGGVPWIPATNHYTEADDGLLQPWEGRVWLNPPYSKTRPWIERLAEHGDGIALLPADTSTVWFHAAVLERADGICFLRHRLRFVRFDPGKETSARYPSILVGYGDEAAEAVVACQLGWVVDQR